MEAKKIYETIADILLPKSKEDLEVSMTQHMGEYKDIIDECYEFIQYHPEHFEINEELGLHYDGYSNWYGFSFLNLFEKNLDEAEYSIKFVEDEDNPRAQKSVIMNQRNGETYKQIKSLDSLVFYFNAYEPIAESVTDVLKPKTDIEMKSLLPPEAEELVDDCYSMVSMNPNYEIEYELGFYQGIYGFYFNTKEPLKTGDEHHLGEIGEYTLGYFTELKGVYLFFENNGYDHKIEKLEDLQMLLIGEDDDYDPRRTNESVSDALKPKAPEEIANELLADSLGDKRNELMNDIDDFNTDDFNDKLDAFVSLLSNEYLSSALEIYLPEEKQLKLYKLFKKGYDIATYAVDYDDFDYVNGAVQLPNFKKSLKTLGWKQFHFEDNMDQGEFIFVKPPQNVNEDLAAVFKPKPEQLVATEYAKQYPVFAKIFYSMFPNETFDVEANADSNRVSARFGFTSGEHKFLVTQDEYHVYPQISYLKKTENTSGFGGIFTHHRDVRTHDDIINYVKQMSGEKY